MTLRAFSVLCILTHFVNFASAQRVSQLLHDWWLLNEQGKSQIFLADVPGNIFNDLQNNKQIDDPFFGTNEAELQWVSKTNWEYRLTFVPEKEIFEKNQIFLCFDALDTRADVFLNGTLVYRSYNMFLPARIDVKDFIVSSENHLEILFYSPLNYADSLWNNYPVRLPDHPRVMMRKAAYQFGWDWGPFLPGCGIRRSVYLDAFDMVSIENLQIITREISDDYALIECIANVNASVETSVYVSFFTQDIEPEDLDSPLQPLTEGENELRFLVKVVDPKLWWPNGMGEQNKYFSELRIYDEQGIMLDIYSDSWGIRTAELILDEDAAGSRFYFRINGKDVFARGANYIPAEFFYEQSTWETYESLISMAARDNMNMLRVWGGGIYEDDAFYELCDIHGIMVWQDFMFACAMYPFDSVFIESVSDEAASNIIRLRNHPSIVLWCGNNEIDEGWHNWGWQQSFSLTSDDSLAIYNGYQTLFENVLPEIVDSLDGTRSYWPSSPSTGWGRKDAYTKGDVHYWGVWWGLRPFESFISHTGRFVSEYGFQGVPQMNTLSEMGVNEENGLNDKTLKAHQKHPRGFETINDYMKMYAQIPENLNDYRYMSQYIQFEGMKTAIEAHRRAMPYCMGTLYWQLNDCWPVVSWSGIDYYGRKKAIQYHIPDLYAPLMISMIEENRQIRVFGISDFLPLEDVELHVVVSDFNGTQIYQNIIKDLIIESCTSKVLFEIDTAIFSNFKSRCFVKAELKKNDRIYAAKVFYPVHMKFRQHPKCDISIQCKSVEETNYITLSAKFLCPFIELTYDGDTGIFEDNYFDLLPGEEKILKITFPLDMGSFDCNKIGVRSLNEIN